MKNNIHW